MQKCFSAIFLSLLCISAIGQNKIFEIFGTIEGKYNSKIYLFYDDNYKQKDSISAEIKDGKFYLKATASLPILARFHLDQRSFIQDVYIDSKKTTITCKNEIEVSAKNNDTTNIFKIVDVKGSKSENLKQTFENWKAALNSSDKSEAEKKEEYYNELYTVVSKNPTSKVSAYLIGMDYLIGQDSRLHYSQVNSLNSLLDTSLQKTYEGKTVAKLLNRRNNAKNRSTGKAFLDVVLKDTSGNQVSTVNLRGKYLLVDFWSSSCKPCREKHPDLKTLYTKLKNKNFEIIGVSFDTEEDKWKSAILKDGIDWVQAIDEKGFSGALAQYYSIEAIPQSILLDKDGKILGVNLSAKQLEDVLNKVL